mmetsp:Transcript_67306/g.162687  ORF Transcript_67306/g.162687 Transcript_67306/m.162687 type:complete len:532 (+) Transcript_67306:2946-4541(+)
MAAPVVRAHDVRRVAERQEELVAAARRGGQGAARDAPQAQYLPQLTGPALPLARATRHGLAPVVDVQRHVGQLGNPRPDQPARPRPALLRRLRRRARQAARLPPGRRLARRRDEQGDQRRAAGGRLRGGRLRAARRRARRAEEAGRLRRARQLPRLPAHERALQAGRGRRQPAAAHVQQRARLHPQAGRRAPLHAPRAEPVPAHLGPRAHPRAQDGRHEHRGLGHQAEPRRAVRPAPHAVAAGQLLARLPRHVAALLLVAPAARALPRKRPAGLRRRLQRHVRRAQPLRARGLARGLAAAQQGQGRARALLGAHGQPAAAGDARGGAALARAGGRRLPRAAPVGHAARRAQRDGVPRGRGRGRLPEPRRPARLPRGLPLATAVDVRRRRPRRRRRRVRAPHAHRDAAGRLLAARDPVRGRRGQLDARRDQLAREQRLRHQRLRLQPGDRGAHPQGLRARLLDVRLHARAQLLGAPAAPGLRPLAALRPVARRRRRLVGRPREHDGRRAIPAEHLEQRRRCRRCRLGGGAAQ